MRIFTVANNNNNNDNNNNNKGSKLSLYTDKISNTMRIQKTIYMPCGGTSALQFLVELLHMKLSL